MPTPSTASNLSEGLFRFSGLYGSAWRNGIKLGDVIEVSGAVEINRIEVPLVGQTRQGYKPGRETREGTMRIQKMDTKWEMEVYQYLALSLQKRRQNRDQGRPTLRPFQLQVEYDDPDSLGIEKWVLHGVLMWRMPIGFSITDDLVDREFPITWEAEEPLYAFQAQPNASGAPSPAWFPGYGPPPPTQ
jgi:Phage tail tube protein